MICAEAPRVELIDWEERRVVTSEPRILPIVHLFDRRGRPVPTRCGAVIVFAGEPGAWFSIPLCPIEPRQLQ